MDGGMDGGLEWNISDYIASKIIKIHKQTLKSVMFEENIFFVKTLKVGTAGELANDFQ